MARWRWCDGMIVMTRWSDDAVMARWRWHNGDDAKEHRTIVIAPSRFRHRAIALSSSCHHAIAIGPSLQRVIAIAPSHHRPRWHDVAITMARWQWRDSDGAMLFRVIAIASTPSRHHSLRHRSIAIMPSRHRHRYRAIVPSHHRPTSQWYDDAIVKSYSIADWASNTTYK